MREWCLAGTGELLVIEEATCMTVWECVCGVLVVVRLGHGSVALVANGLDRLHGGRVGGRGRGRHDRVGHPQRSSEGKTSNGRRVGLAGEKARVTLSSVNGHSKHQRDAVI